MKKSLLLAIASTFAVSAMNAQPFAEGVKHFSDAPVAKRLVASVGKAAKKAPAAAKPVYYLSPSGSLFQDYDRNGVYYGPSYLVVPANQWVKFEKAGTATGPYLWHQNIMAFAGDVTTLDRTGQTGTHFRSDADDNFYLKSVFNGTDAAPTIICGTDSFTLCEDNQFWLTDNPYSMPGYYTRMLAGEDAQQRRIQPVAFTDSHVSVLQLGALESNYIYGTGKFVNDGATYTCTGVYQNFPKPMAPLYVEDIFFNALSKSETPIPAGKELKLVVRNIIEGENGQRIPGEKVIAELTCTSGTVKALGEISDGADKYHTFNLMFAQKVDGKAKGFLIDEPFSVVVYGFDQEGVDVGLTGSAYPYYLQDMEPAQGTFLLGSAPAYINLYGEKNVALRATFSAMYDYCNPYIDGDGNFGIVKVDDSGEGCQAVADKENKFGGGVLSVNSPWKDEEGNANYEISGAADWVKDIIIDAQTYSEYGIVVLKFSCDPLPEGVSTRSCKLFLKGVRGSASTEDIIVFQGEDVYTAIGSVKADGKADGKAYNVAGQRVSDNAKGLVIKNGKKFFLK